MAKLSVSFVIFATLLVGGAFGDIFLHNPRGFNNRLNEANTNRNNANRLFDTQNNAQGGYCYGPAMSYYEGSRLSIEWSPQHGSGLNPRLQSNTVIQYMCGASSDGAYTNVRDGETTDTIMDATTGPTALGSDQNYLYGMHESYQSYQVMMDRFVIYLEGIARVNFCLL
jgi:hypothetical protein